MQVPREGVRQSHVLALRAFVLQGRTTILVLPLRLRGNLQIRNSHRSGVHSVLTQISLDPAEQVSEQQKAFATHNHASAGERLAIEWNEDAMDHKLISAIVKMNDLLRQYPHDKWVVWMTTWWLTTETQYERSIEVYERSGITDSPGLMNNLAYSYAYLRQFDKAFALMDKYVAALPSDANPQDSYAEILRMAGHFEQSIAHYRASLAIDSEFYSLQFGIADTYSLMGDQIQARKQYEIGFRKFSLPELHKIQWETREAITYVRQGDYEGADRAFQAIADYAHIKNMSQVEADTDRQMAMYQQDGKHALSLLKKADVALRERKNVMQAASNQELAQILRARVEAALKTGNKKLIRASLEGLTDLSQTSNDKLIEAAYVVLKSIWVDSPTNTMTYWRTWAKASSTQKTTAVRGLDLTSLLILDKHHGCCSVAG
jgi:tetratricopeptide (TPR) repeat protein